MLNRYRNLEVRPQTHELPSPNVLIPPRPEACEGMKTLWNLEVGVTVQVCQYIFLKKITKRQFTNKIKE